MFDVHCPSCGRAGSIPKEKEHSRLVCKKCHGVFHINDRGKAQLGEPPAAHPARPVHAIPDEDAAESRGGFSRAKIAGIAVALSGLIAGGFWMVASERSESLNVRARKAVNALVASDLNGLRHFVKPGSENDAAQLLAAIGPEIETMKNASLTSRVESSLLVTEEDLVNGFGQVSLFLSPSGVKARDRLDVEPTGKRGTSEYVFSWYRDGSGRWMLDGQSTLQRLLVSR